MAKIEGHNLTWAPATIAAHAANTAFMVMWRVGVGNLKLRVQRYLQLSVFRHGNRFLVQAVNVTYVPRVSITELRRSFAARLSPIADSFFFFFRRVLAFSLFLCLCALCFSATDVVRLW